MRSGATGQTKSYSLKFRMIYRKAGSLQTGEAETLTNLKSFFKIFLTFSASLMQMLVINPLSETAQ